MEFGLSEEQQLLSDSITRWVQSTVTRERLQQLGDEGETASAPLIEGLAELGAFGVLVPEAHGGSGLGLFEAVLVQEALGRGAVPVPWTATALLAPLALAEGPSTLAEQWLPRIASGEVRIGVGLSELAGARAGTGLHLEHEQASGTVRFVLDGAGADAYLLAAGPDDLVWIDGDALSTPAIPLATIDRTRSLVELTLDRVPCTPLTEAGMGGARLAHLLAAGRVALAADAFGAGQTMLERAVAYAQERKQFDRVIGSFQAVKHLCAEMAAELEPCRALIWYAAHAADAYPQEFELMACHAKAHMGEVGQFVARTATEVHGGIGFTHEMGLHWFFKRIGLDRQLLGNPDRVRQDAARINGWAA
ncbi:MAG: acyl-CoA dehydrogenase family protein [Pseudomonadales bacterium]|jgi:alkylation response protein AidB-like acyl-CoA dehydrogenase|nr:acyl-CoA dehydrogenase family protein [Pseudomonadales bacterium]